MNQQKDHGDNQPDDRDHVQQADCEVTEHGDGNMVANWVDAGSDERSRQVWSVRHDNSISLHTLLFSFLL